MYQENAEHFPEKLFFELCREKFRFLTEEFGFQEAEANVAPDNGIRTYGLLFLNPSTETEVDIRWGKDLQSFYVLLFSKREIYGFELDNLLEFRAPEFDLKADDLETLVARHAYALRTYAQDALRGDFSTIRPEMEKRAKEHLDRYAQEFFALCREQFNFLFEEFGFREAETRSIRRGYGIDLFKSETTVIEVSDENEYLRVFVWFGRLRDGKGFYLDDLAELRAPHFDLGKGTEEEVKNYAGFLREYGKDILRGDFSVFSELDKIVEARKRKLSGYEGLKKKMEEREWQRKGQETP